MERDTVGRLSTELLRSDTATDHSVGEQMQEQLSEYEQNIFECVARSKGTFPADFYIVVLTKRERLMTNVLRHYFFGRLSCPTPDYDQAVYKYDHKDESITFLWVIPSKDACAEIRTNYLMLDPSYAQLIRFVLDFYEGALEKKARALNGELIMVGNPVV